MVVHLYIGCMFAGKSSNLLRHIRRANYAKKSYILIKHSIDDRFSQNKVITHDGIEYDAISVPNLESIYTMISKYDYILIDEGQFFKDIVDFVKKFGKTKEIAIAALDGTYDQKPFGKILDIIPLSEKVIKLSAICRKCGGDAHFTKLMDNGSKDVIQIGGEDKYEARCRECL